MDAESRSAGTIQFGYWSLLVFVVVLSLVLYGLVAVDWSVLGVSVVLSYALVLCASVFFSNRCRVRGLVWIGMSIVVWGLFCLCLSGYATVMTDRAASGSAEGVYWPFTQVQAGELTVPGAAVLLDIVKHIMLCVLVISGMSQIVIGSRECNSR